MIYVDIMGYKRIYVYNYTYLYIIQSHLWGYNRDMEPVDQCEGHHRWDHRKRKSMDINHADIM